MRLNKCPNAREQVKSSVDEAIEEFLVDRTGPFILGGIPFTVTAIEKPPRRRVNSKGVRKRLKDDVALVRAIAVNAESRQC